MIKTILMTLLFVSTFGVKETKALIAAPPSNEVDATGTVTRKDKVFIKVRNNYGSTISRGAVVVWDLTQDNGVDVTLSATDGAAYVACVAEEDISANKMGLCQVWGYHDAVLFTAGDNAGEQATAGEGIYLSDNDIGRAKGFTTPLAKYKQLGVWLDSATTTSAVEAFLRIL